MRQVVEIEWGDAWVSTDDVTLKKAQTLGPVMRSSVGFLVAESEEGITIAMDAYEKDDKNLHTHAFIPWGWIKSYWVYRDVV